MNMRLLGDKGRGGPLRGGFTLVEVIVSIAVSAILLSALCVFAAMFARVNENALSSAAGLSAYNRLRRYAIENADFLTEGSLGLEKGKIINLLTGEEVSSSYGITDVSVYCDYSTDENGNKQAAFMRCGVTADGKAYSFIIKAYPAV